MKLIKPEKISIRNHPELNEKWVQEIIADDPAILGLGDLILMEKERIQPKAGRLDLLLQHADTDRRFEVEIQLGKVDESHIIRTIEYWDIERKRYPGYDHCAVIIAEDITSRFLNVVNLFNGFIPLIALQMSAMKFGDNIALIFTRVLDEVVLGLEEYDYESNVTDRKYWATKVSNKATVALADQILEIIHEFAPDLELKYNKYYIGFAENSKANRFVTFKPNKKSFILNLKSAQSDKLYEYLTQLNLEVIDYRARIGSYRIRLTRTDIDKNRKSLAKILKAAYTHKLPE